jgi:hypothetical protein
MRFTKPELLATFAREERCYRLGLLCTHYIRDVEHYEPNAADLAAKLSMKVDNRWIDNVDLSYTLSDPEKRELLSAEFLLTYLHTLIRAPYELLDDYCQDFEKLVPTRSLRAELRSQGWHPVASIIRNAVSHNFRLELGRVRDKLPITWRTITISADMDGQPMAPTTFWHKPGYELFLEMRAFAEGLPEYNPGTP